ncbi:helix-turn-helix domain-containing protein [Bacillus piscicola]|uniref:helix-turn-helix domain-containing protein n=1 Tax=Bacillus piscicola TaxID=1632684 RepID=UPI001F095189|nr:helix-turn-helix domain-containing protein [Bacillus piscicola]
MLGEKIKRYRRKKGLSLSELSRRANLSKSYISDMERDIKKNPSIDVLKKIAAVLDVSIEELIMETSLGKGKQADPLDEAWRKLVTEAIASGLSKEQFKEFSEYIKYTKGREKQDE